MANNSVKINVNVSDNGTVAAVTKKVQALKDLLTQTAGIASSINMGGVAGGGATATPTSGGTRSSRAAAGRAPSASAGAAGSSATGGTYAQARATVGTGAGARDFARESEGLGGLVRVYATFAANIFAATMAFSALSKAMDTTNMIAGLDQLGAQSGKSLGAVAKNLVAATSGAISLREAMTATAQASAAGMSSKDILRMGVAAKNASAILGVDMTDALSRLSRGITKLEPELLDELGIFTKITQSNEAYALKLGKSSLALTDFEKRQGFANAVLAEAESKFGAIKVDVNPYAQLSAALKNVSQTSLEFVNTALGPLVKLLSESPTALLAGLALIGGILVKQAIPALSQFGSKLRQTADDAEAKASSIQATLTGLGPARSSLLGFDLQRVALDRIATSARSTATGFRILSNAVDNTKLLGFTSAFTLLKAEITAAGTALTSTQGKVLLFKGVMAIGVTAIGTLASAFGGAVSQIAMVIGLLGMLSSWFGKNAKESQATTSALDTLDDSIKNVDRTIAAINARPLLAQLTAESLAARATAFQGLTTSMLDSIVKLQEEVASRNWMDSTTNWIAGIIGKDSETKIANSLNASFTKAFKIAGSTLDLTDFKADLADLLKLPGDTTTGGLLAALQAATPAVKALAAERLDKLSTEFNNAAQGAKDFNTQMMGTSKLYDEIAVKYQTSDSSAKFGERQAKDALTLNRELGNTKTAIAAMISIVGDVDKLKLFEPADAEILRNMAPQLNEIGEKYAENNRLLGIEAEALAEINAQIAEKQRLLAQPVTLKGLGARGAAEADLPILLAKQSALTPEVARREKIKAELQGNTEFFNKAFSTAATNSFIAGSARVTAAIEAGFVKSKTIIQEATLSLFPENKATIKEQAAIAKAQIQSDIKKIESDNNLIDSQERLRIAFVSSEVRKGVEARVNKKEGAISSEEQTTLEKLLTYQTKLTGEGNQFKPEDLEAFKALVKESEGKTISPAVMASFADTQSLINKKSSTQAALDVKRAEGIAVDIKSAGKIRAEESKETIRLIDSAISGIDRAQQIIQQRVGGMTVPEAQTAQQGLAGQKRAEEFTKAQESIKAIIREAEITGKKDQLAIAQKNLANLKTEQDATEATAQVVDQMVSSRAEIADIISRQNKVEDDNLQIINLSSQESKSKLEFAGQQLDYNLSIGKVTQDEYDSQKRLNALKQLEIELESTLLGIKTKSARAEQAIQVQLDTQGISSAKMQQLYAERDAQKLVTAAEIDAAKVSYDLRVQSAHLGDEMNERTKTYADAFKSTVMSMTDALVDFALTGKASFGDMIKSMIIDLIKFEQRRQMTQAFGALGGFGGIAGSIVGSLFGPSTATAGELANGGGYGAENATYRTNALGGAYDQGRVAFAKGGTFSNTIVTRPTTFAFANGAGLMGEAGPEAIMPLKRGANGSLGVQGGSGGGNVDVVVNNYGTEKASTKESTDSRGNRRIEVIIGELTAAEMSRPNSPVQASMRGTFGISPQLTRR